MAAAPLIMAAAESHARDTSLTLGVGAGLGPEFEGSSDYRPIPFLAVRWDHGGYYVQLRGTRLEANVLSGWGFQAGPLLNLRFERDDVENDAVDALPEVDFALEGGAFAQASLTLSRQLPQSLSFRMEFLHDVSGVHDGFTASPSLEYSARWSRRFVTSFSLSSTYSGGGFTDAYFSVTPSGAAASGLSAFDADPGIKDVAIGLEVRYRLSESLAVVALARGTRLLGDAGDSPIVDQAGSPNQVFGGTLLSYRLPL